MVEEEPKQPRERTTDPREATGKLSHLTSFAESQTRTHEDRGEMAVVRNGQRFRPLRASLLELNLLVGRIIEFSATLWHCCISILLNSTMSCEKSTYFQPISLIRLNNELGKI